MHLLISYRKDLLIITTLFFVNLFIHSINLNKTVNVYTDAGTYLYSAKLITQGFIPYKDFFLAHSVFLIYLIAFILKLVSFNIYTMNIIYITWFFSSIFPIYFIVYKLTKDRLSAFLSIFLFSTFPELVQWDAHSFSLRQGSLPFLAFSLFFTFVISKFWLAGILLGFFALSVISNLLVAVILIFTIISGELLFYSKNLFVVLNKYRMYLLSFVLPVILGFSFIILIPNGIANVFQFQINRNYTPLDVRFIWLVESLKINWPILLLGSIGSLVINNRVKFFGLFNIFSMLIIVSIGSSFYVHYITILAVGYSISAGTFISKFTKTLVGKLLVTILLLICLYISSYKYLKYHLIEKITPDFFELTKSLEKTPEPLLAFEAIYSIYSQKEIVHNYYAPVFRYLNLIGKNFSDNEYLSILENVNTVLLEPFVYSLIPSSSLEYINYNFSEVYNDSFYKLYVRKGHINETQ